MLQALIHQPSKRRCDVRVRCKSSLICSTDLLSGISRYFLMWAASAVHRKHKLRANLYDSFLELSIKTPQTRARIGSGTPSSNNAAIGLEQATPARHCRHLELCLWGSASNAPAAAPTCESVANQRWSGASDCVYAHESGWAPRRHTSGL
jgi:hypothetical protein